MSWTFCYMGTKCYVSSSTGKVWRFFFWGSVQHYAHFQCVSLPAFIHNACIFGFVFHSYRTLAWYGCIISYISAIIDVYTWKKRERECVGVLYSRKFDITWQTVANDCRQQWLKCNGVFMRKAAVAICLL